MIYRIKEKVWSQSGEFPIMDESNSPCYFVKRQTFSWGIKFSFKDSNKNNLGYIGQKLYSWEPLYEIVSGGNHFGEVALKSGWFNSKKFILNVFGSDNYIIKGAFWKHEFEFTRKEMVVARVSKKKWNWRDDYGVEILGSKDHFEILGTCIVIGQVQHDFKH